MRIAYHKQPGAVGNVKAQHADDLPLRANFGESGTGPFHGLPVVFLEWVEGYPFFKSLDADRYRWDPHGKGGNEGFVWSPEDVEWTE